jgi:hypothetical protein
MNSCSEFQLDDLMAVTAVPIANIPATDPSSPVNRLTATVGTFTPSYSGAITIGRQSPGGNLIPIVRDSGKATDDEGDSVAGRLHTVKVSCEADDRDGTVWADLLTLERTPRHLILMFRGGARAFVAATRDTYTCTVERSGAKTSVTFTVKNLMGIQLMT